MKKFEIGELCEAYSCLKQNWFECTILDTKVLGWDYLILVPNFSNNGTKDLGWGIEEARLRKKLPPLSFKCKLTNPIKEVEYEL